ncbi:hypothetical protein ECG_07783 [Echinococcus granulosus]|uniref:Toxin n=1 Tax=Echinococcus granulosus TaxID=6210 RepID=A0A068WRE3_ECHGR|nr:hypothetical protein ECG_07783 [Echinococcus granulosus]CDS22344.1 hypothetical protein EgrG_000354500 [Echinococcus granulosus]
MKPGSLHLTLIFVLLYLGECCLPQESSCFDHLENCGMFGGLRCCRPMYCLAKWGNKIGKCRHPNENIF